MNYRHQHITHHKYGKKFFLNTVKIKLPEVKNKAGQVIRKEMTYLKPVTVQVLHKRTA